MKRNFTSAILCKARLKRQMIMISWPSPNISAERERILCYFVQNLSWYESSTNSPALCSGCSLYNMLHQLRPLQGSLSLDPRKSLTCAFFSCQLDHGLLYNMNVELFKSEMYRTLKQGSLQWQFNHFTSVLPDLLHWLPIFLGLLSNDDAGMQVSTHNGTHRLLLSIFGFWYVSVGFRKELWLNVVRMPKQTFKASI